MIITITSIPNPDILHPNAILFTIDSIETVILSATGFQWYLNSIPIDAPIGTDIEYRLESPDSGDAVYVKVYESVDVFWYDGQFYGGSFKGNFSGGTFHYGILNGHEYAQVEPKPKIFIENIKNVTDSVVSQASKSKSKLSQILRQIN